jgi:hypothetical protein
MKLKGYRKQQGKRVLRTGIHRIPSQPCPISVSGNVFRNQMHTGIQGGSWLLRELFLQTWRQQFCLWMFLSPLKQKGKAGWRHFGQWLAGCSRSDSEWWLEGMTRHFVMLPGLLRFAPFTQTFRGISTSSPHCRNSTTEKSVPYMCEEYLKISRKVAG